MPQITKRKLAISALLLLIGALIGWDIYSHQAQTFFVGTAGSAQQAQEPLQVEGLPLLRPSTLTLGEGRSDRGSCHFERPGTGRAGRP